VGREEKWIHSGEELRKECSDLFFFHSEHGQEYTTQFDLRKPLNRAMWTAPNIECLSLQGGSNFALLQEKCSAFFDSLARFVSTCHKF
jgi:hypothetical protein